MAQKIMTEATYRQRKSALAVALEGAQQEYRKAAYQEEVGEAPKGAAAEARRRIAEVEAKQLGLEGAWSESIRLADEEAARMDRRERRIALSKVDRLLAKRSEAIAAIEKLLVGIGDHVRRFEEAGEEIGQVMRPYSKLLSPDGQGYGELLRAVRQRSDFEAIGGILFGQGVDLTNVRGQQAWFRQRERGLSALIAMRNRAIRTAAGAIEPEEPVSFEEKLEAATSEPTILSEA